MGHSKSPNKWDLRDDLERLVWPHLRRDPIMTELFPDTHTLLVSRTSPQHSHLWLLMHQIPTTSTATARYLQHVTVSHGPFYVRFCSPILVTVVVADGSYISTCQYYTRWDTTAWYISQWSYSIILYVVMFHSYCCWWTAYLYDSQLLLLMSKRLAWFLAIVPDEPHNSALHGYFSWCTK